MQIDFMKTLLYVSAIAILFSACEKKKTIDDSTACVAGQNPGGWNVEQLSLNYNISFPGGYNGGGYIVFEGDMFNKRRYSSVDSVYIIAAYGNSGLSTSVWGPVLVNTSATSVDVNHKGRMITLKNKRRICYNNNTLGYYYYTLTNGDTTSTNKGTGAIYLREDNKNTNTDFMQNIIIDFPVSREEEIAGIVSSIRPRQ
jgi:hypothetical protein